MTYVDAQVLARETLLNIVNNFPTSWRTFRRASVLLALRRHITHAAKGDCTSCRTCASNVHQPACPSPHVLVTLAVYLPQHDQNAATRYSKA